MTSQQQALSAGDPAAISAATRPLAAYLLREVAGLRLLEGKFTEAIELDRKSVQLDDSSKTRLELATNLIRAGHPQEAANEAAAVLQADANDASAWVIRGSALRAAGNDKEAVEAFSRALELKSDVNVAYALGATLLAVHEKEKAERIFRQIITASGNAAIWHVAVGDAYRTALYLAEAVEEFKKAIAIDPRVGHAEFFLGLTYLQMNQWGPNSESFEHLRAAVRLAPREYISNFYLGALESTDGSDLPSSNRHLHVAAEANPSSAEAWLYLGLNAAREKNTAAAETYLRKAIDLTGNDEARNNYQIRRVYAVLGRILISEGNQAEGAALLAKYKRTEQQAIRDSANVITQAAEASDARAALSGIPVTKVSFPGMNPASPPATEYANTPGATGPVAPRRGPEETRQIAAAEHQFSQLLAVSFNDLGTAEARLGHYTNALADFQEAERWDAPTPVLLHNLGVAAFKVDNFSESARALTLYLDAKKDVDAAGTVQDERSHMMLAMSLFSLGRFAEAAKAFGPISAQAMQDPRAAYAWAYSLARSDQQPEANRIADQLVKQELPPEVLSLVCHLYRDTENYEHSVTCFRKASQVDPTLKQAHYLVGESLIRLDRPAEAIPELRQELVVSPNDPNVQFSLAYALLQTSHKQEATELLETVIAAQPTHAQAQYELGKLLLEQGKIPEAITHLELAEQNDPSPDYIHYQLQTAYRRAGRTADADREAKIYRDIKAQKREITPQHTAEKH